MPRTASVKRPDPSASRAFLRPAPPSKADQSRAPDDDEAEQSSSRHGSLPASASAAREAVQSPADVLMTSAANELPGCTSPTRPLRGREGSSLRSPINEWSSSQAASLHISALSARLPRKQEDEGKHLRRQQGRQQLTRADAGHEGTTKNCDHPR